MKNGDRILDYVVDRELGEGGMGKVYLARHTVLDQQVAVKVLDPEVARKPGVRERFIQEANIQAKLKHPGIVQVLTATHIEGGAPVLVMEYVDGISLSEVIELRESLPVGDALKIMAQILSAVGYAHKQGVIHRDLKPSNVMVMAHGEAKVTDFGIAKVLGSAKLTRTGTAMGSAHYMSPEQIRRPEAVDARSDIYSLGCVFYEVLTGRPPFGEKDTAGTESDFEIKTAHVNEAAPAPSVSNKNIPAWLDQLIKQSLEKEADRRPRSCEAMLEQIHAAGQARSADTLPAKTKSPVPSASKTIKPHIAASLVIAVFVSAAFFAVMINKRTDSGSTAMANNSYITELEKSATPGHSQSRAAADLQDSAAVKSIQTLKTLEENSIEMVKTLLSTWSESDEKAYAFMEYTFAENIFFYGSNKDKKEILTNKIKFMQRWNSRNYVGRQDTFQIECNIQTSRCVINGVLDWKAVSDSENLISQGSATFEYGMDFSGDSPKIYMESGKVLKRDLTRL